jgi:hypothetical protein
VFIENQTIDIIRKQPKVEIDNNMIDKMITFLSDVKVKRQTAFRRLAILYFYNLLSETQEKCFAEGLWNYRDNTGFPDETNFFQFAFLELPHPDDVRPNEILDDYILKTNFPIQSSEKSKGIQMTGGYFPIFENIKGTANKQSSYLWDSTKINSLLNRLIEWWNADKKYLKQDNRYFDFDEFKSRFNNMISIFINVFSPNINLIDAKYISEIKMILDELDDYSIPDIASKAVFIDFFPDDEYVLIEDILQNLKSKEKDSIIDSINAIRVLLRKSHKMLANVIKVVAELINYRMELYLDRYINLMIHILKDHRDIVTDDIVDDILIGLDYLSIETNIGIDDTDEIIHKKLTNRNSCAELACLLKNCLIGENKDIPRAIAKWEKICLDENEFSEIRITWINCSLTNIKNKIEGQE